MLKRFSISLVGGAAMALGLGLVMKAMISSDFKAEEKVKTANFEINPKVDDIKIVRRETKVQEIKKVVTPPPPPLIERTKAARPDEPITPVDKAIPDFKMPKMGKQDFVIQVSDRNAEPLGRVPPIMPPRAEKSGHCKMRFDVSPEGEPFNVQATFCSQSIFSGPSIKSVQKWRYSPKIADGRSVARIGVETQITFLLEDEHRNIIPE